MKFLSLLFLNFLANAYETELLYGFKYLNFTFTDPADANAYDYTACMLGGIKVNSRGDFFVSVPRWKAGVPATLSKLVKTTDGVLLQPFPSWEENEVGLADTLQSVLGFEIDDQDRIWVLDQGKVNGQPAIAGSLKVVVYDSIKGNELMRFDL